MNEQPHPEVAILNAVLELPAGQRAAYLDQVCAGDTALRQQVEALLQAHEQAGGFLETTPAGLAFQKTVLVSFPLTEKPGDKIGRYKLRETLGEGGCGVVYVAEQEEPVRRRVALKVIKLGMDTQQVVARFEAERQALAMMDHPNIAKVLDAGTTETGRPYFVMELVRGIRITDYCDQTNLTTKDRLDLFIKVCQAIQHAHQKGIIHRDIKPSNILVTLHDGVPVPKVIDFGIAKATEGRLTDATVYTQLHQFIGTPAYMSPEQAEMSGLDIDTRSDIYSLGVLLYELLAGSTPFDATELMASGIDAMRKTIREKEPVRPSTKLSQTLVAANVSSLQSPATGKPATEEEVRADSRRLLRIKETITLLRGDLDWIVMKCLEKDRARRYETANGLAADLKRHLNNEPVVARPPSAAYRFQKAVRRNKLAFAAATAVAAALVIGLGSATVMFSRERLARHGEQQQRLEAQSAQKVAAAQARKASESEEQSRRLLYASDVNLARVSLDHDHNLARALDLLERHRPHDKSEIDLRGWEWRYLRSRCRSDELATLTRPDARHADAVISLAFSSDGRWLASGGHDGAVKLFDVATRREWTTLWHGNTVRAVAFSPRDGTLATLADDGFVCLWDVPARRVVERIPAKANTFVGAVGFSPDGSLLAIGETDGWLTVTNVMTQFVFRTKAHWAVTALAFSPDGRTLATLPAPGERGKIKLWDLATFQVARSFDQLGWGVATLAFSPDSRRLVSTSIDRTTKIWDTVTGDLLETLRNPISYSTAALFLPDNRTLAVANSEHTITLWDLEARTERTTLKGHLADLWAMARSPDGTLLASGSTDGEVKLWSTTFHSDPTAFVTDVSTLSTDKRSILASRTKGVLEIWDSATLTQTQRIEFDHTNANRFALTSDRTVIASRDDRGLVKLWRLDGDTAHEEANFTTKAGFGPLEFSPDERMLAATGYRALFLWNLQRRQILQTLRLADRMANGTASGVMTAVKFSPDSQRIASGDSEGTLSLWLVESGQLLWSAKGHRRQVADLAFFPDGRTLVSGSWDAQAKLWEVATGREIAVLKGCVMGADSVAVSPDGRRVAIGAGEGAIRLWMLDGSQPREVATLPTVDGRLFHPTAFLPDGNTLLAISNGRAFVWRAPPFAEIENQEAKRGSQP